MKLYLTFLFFWTIITSSAQLPDPKICPTKLAMASTKDTFNINLLSDTTQYTEIYSADGSEDFTSDPSKKLYWLNKTGILGIYNKKYIYLGYYQIKNNSLSFIKSQP